MCGVVPLMTMDAGGVDIWFRSNNVYLDKNFSDEVSRSGVSDNSGVLAYDVCDTYDNGGVDAGQGLEWNIELKFSLEKPG